MSKILERLENLLDEQSIGLFLDIFKETVLEPKYEYIYIYHSTWKNWLGQEVYGFIIEGAYSEKKKREGSLRKACTALFNELGSNGWKLAHNSSIGYDKIAATARNDCYIFERKKISNYTKQCLSILDFKLAGNKEIEEYFDFVEVTSDELSIDVLELPENLLNKLREKNINFVSEFLDEIDNFWDLDDKFGITEGEEIDNLVSCFENLDSKIRFDHRMQKIKRIFSKYFENILNSEE